MPPAAGQPAALQGTELESVSLFYEYSTLEYVHIHGIYRVKGALQLLINRYG